MTDKEVIRNIGIIGDIFVCHDIRGNVNYNRSIKFTTIKLEKCRFEYVGFIINGDDSIYCGFYNNNMIQPECNIIDGNIYTAAIETAHTINGGAICGQCIVGHEK